MVEEKTEIIEKMEALPNTIEELIDFVIVSNEAVKGFKAKLKACDKAEIAKEARDQTLRDGRKISRLHIDAETRLGELLSKNPPGFTKKNSGIINQNPLPSGINKKESHYAQEIYRHPEIIEEVFTTKTNDIPTRHDILKKIKHKKRKEKQKQQEEKIKAGIDKPDGLYDIIVVDPPWKFEGNYDADGRRVTASYPQMNYNEIKELDIPAKDNCILWLWTTHRDISMAFEIMQHWGFDYKGILVWDKEKMGIGTWLRFQCEFCLLGIKGRPLWKNKGIRDIIREPRTGHSNKPDSFYKMIDENFIGKKLDYFYGKKRKGWDRIGTGENSLSE